MFSIEHKGDGERDLLIGCICKRKTDKSVLLPWRKRVGLVVFAVLQNGLAGGIIFGWASIDTTMLSAAKEDGGAGLSFHQTTSIFSWASCVAMLSSLVLGILLDSYGPRLCSIVSCCIVAGGCQTFAASRSFLSLAIGACLIAFGGPGINSSIIHIANTFPNNENLVMSCLSGSIALSFSVFAVFDLLWARYEAATFRNIFSIYSLIAVALAFGAFVMYPDEPFEEVQDDLSESEEPFATAPSTDTNLPDSVDEELPLTKDYEIDAMARFDPPHASRIRSMAPSLTVEQPLESYLRDGSKMLKKTESFFASKKVLNNPNVCDVDSITLKDQPFYAQLFSASYFRSILVFLVTCFVTNFYVVSFSIEVSELQCTII